MSILAAPPRPVNPARRLADRLWFGETVALLITRSAFDTIDRGRDDLVDDVWSDLGEENREHFRSYLRMLGSPAIGWFSWVNLCWSGSLVRFPGSTTVEVEPAPTVEDRVDVSPEAEAEWSGFELGLQGLAVAGPAHYSPGELAAFLRGHAAGFKSYEENELAAFEARGEIDPSCFAPGGPEATWTDAELVEARGFVAQPAWES